MSDAIVVVVFDGYADWEPALAMAELARAGRRVVTAGLDGPGEIRSMGGLRVLPERALAELDPGDGAAWILPGGDRWAADAALDARIVAAVERRLALGRTVAAICGATAPLARGGAFAGRRHTSNDPGWLSAVAPGYPGREGYVEDVLAVTDGALVTASGTGHVAFAAEILAALGVYSPARREVWRHLYQTGRFPPDADIQAFFAD